MIGSTQAFQSWMCPASNAPAALNTAAAGTWIARCVVVNGWPEGSVQHMAWMRPSTVLSFHAVGRASQSSLFTHRSLAALALPPDQLCEQTRRRLPLTTPFPSVRFV
ncbi:unnamed protein product [Cercospora beticola]|nr:unnamed protein product [Cercospora beticola]